MLIAGGSAADSDATTSVAPAPPLKEVPGLRLPAVDDRSIEGPHALHCTVAVAVVAHSHCMALVWADDVSAVFLLLLSAVILNTRPMISSQPQPVQEATVVPSAVARSVWSTALSARVSVASSASPTPTPLYAPGPSVSAHDRDRCSYAGEPILVRVSVYNPLHLPLMVQELALRCRYLGDEAAYPDDALVSPSVLAEITALSSQTVELYVVPHREGTLQVQGVTWRVFECVRGFHAFNCPPKRSIITKSGVRFLLVCLLSFFLLGSSARWGK